MDEPLIRLAGVHKTFFGQPVLQGVDLDVPRGQITTIIGKSGVGKSVTLKLMIGLLEPDAGEIFYQGQPVSRMARAERRGFRRRISYLFQSGALFDSLTVFENVALPLEERGDLSEAEIGHRVRERLRQLDLKGIEEAYPARLSGGMRKRVALARALVTDPETILFDEPTTGLDPVRKAAVHVMITDHQKRLGFTGVVVSHEIPDVFSFTQHIAMLDEGAIRFAGTPDEIQQSEDPVVRQFIYGLEVRRDALTGLFHPPRIGQRFREEMHRLETEGVPFSLLLLTVENLDEINGRVGYVAGQGILKRLAEHVRAHLGPSDVAARLGGDRLAVLLAGEDQARARAASVKLTGELGVDGFFLDEVPPGLCLRLHAGVAQAAKGMRLEDLTEGAEADRNATFEFSFCALEGP